MKGFFSSDSHGSRKRLHRPETQPLSVPYLPLDYLPHTSTPYSASSITPPQGQVEMPLRNGLWFLLVRSGNCILGCRRVGDNCLVWFGFQEAEGDKGSPESEQRKIETPYAPLLTSRATQ